jgi:hypothetical protein
VVSIPKIILGLNSSNFVIRLLCRFGFFLAGEGGGEVTRNSSKVYTILEHELNMEATKKDLSCDQRSYMTSQAPIGER